MSNSSEGSKKNNYFNFNRDKGKQHCRSLVISTMIAQMLMCCVRLIQRIRNHWFYFLNFQDYTVVEMFIVLRITEYLIKKVKKR